MDINLRFPCGALELKISRTLVAVWALVYLAWWTRDILEKLPLGETTRLLEYFTDYDTTTWFCTRSEEPSGWFGEVFDYLTPRFR